MIDAGNHSVPLHTARHKRTLSLYRWYVLALLWAVALLRFVDLQILAVLLEPIKAEFHLSDTELSLLGGLAFALFYGTLGLPVAWLADRYSRRNIIAFAVALWSLMTALCGQAGSFFWLFLARMGVGIGEAGAYPPSTSLLADYFRPQQRGLACAILASAIPVGVFVGFMVGGVVAQHSGWRAAFGLVGLPGVVLGLLVFLSVREPRRGSHDDTKSEDLPQEPFMTSVRILWQNKPYRHVVMGACLFTLGAAGSGVWIPSYFIRFHGLSSAEVGIWMAVLYGGGGLLGALSSGWLAERAGTVRKDGLGKSRLCCYSLICCLPLLPLIFLNPDPRLALGYLFLMTVLMHMNTGPVLALLQQLAGCERRAMAHAISVLFSNLLALPLGPMFVGLCSDHLGPRFGPGTLGWAILALLLGAWSCSAWHFHQATRAQGSAAAANRAIS
jgi:predicted MFS family arabinose efflux permease